MIRIHIFGQHKPGVPCFLRGRRSLFFLGIILVLCSSTSAQVDTASISGVITDQSGAIIVGADVRVTNSDTNVTSAITSNQSGVYLITGLKPGRYRIKVAKEGFKGIDLTDLILNVQDSVSRNFTLQVGSASETVSVEGNGLQVNTQDASVSTVIERNFAENLPLNGRSFNTLMLLTPGVVAVPSNLSGAGQFSIGGQRTNANMFQVDGVSVNFGITSSSGSTQAGGGGTQAFNVYGGTSGLVSVDAMQEFRIETSSYAPEFGRTPGGQVSIVTRSGTNRFHGDAFNYLRNTVLDSNDWFANAAGKPRAPEQQNDFGGVLGGPLWRDRTFFFVSYEGLRLRQPKTQQVTVPTMALRNDPTTVAAALPILNAYPLPDNKNATGSAALFTGVYSNVITMDAGSVRADHTFGPRLTVFGRYDDSPSAVIGRAGALSQIQSQELNTTTVTIGGNSQWTRSVTTSFRFNYSRQQDHTRNSFDSFGAAVPLNIRALLPSPFTVTDSQGSFVPLDGVSSLTAGFVSANHISQWNALFDATYAIRSHQLKFGTNYEQHLLSEAGSADHPSYSPFSTASFASTGNVDIFNNQVTLPGGMIFKAFSLYAQDTWKAKRRLTLTYGLRWELVPSPSPQNGTTLASWLNVDNPAAVILAAAGAPPWQTTYGNFAPRVGAAFQISQKGDLVVRTGWGMFYDLGTGVAPQLLTIFPNLASLNIRMPSSIPVPVPNTSTYVPVPSASAPYNTSLADAFDPNLELPRSYQWNVALEKSFADKQAVSVTYVGQVGRRLLRFENFPRPNSNFIAGSTLHVTTNGDTSDYNALQVQYRAAAIRRVQALLSYTYSHSIDTTSDDSGSFNFPTVAVASGTRGSSNFDLRHNLTGTVVYAIPGWRKNTFASLLTNGWSTSLVAFAHSGYPIDVLTPFFSGGNLYRVRPDLVPGQPIWIMNPSVPGGMQLNKAAFAVPTTLREGTLGRNSIRGFDASQFDMSLQRKFALSEGLSFQFRTDAFNVFNHPNFSNPGGGFSAFVSPLLFGRSFSMLNGGLGGLNPLYQIGGPRSLQLSLKLAF